VRLQDLREFADAGVAPALHAVLTNERDYFSTIDVQVDTFQDAYIAERLRDLGKGKQRHQKMTAINRFIFFP
jgi:hypothetical protein